MVGLHWPTEMQMNEDDGPHLTVVRSSSMKNWRNELARWAPRMNVGQYRGSQDECKDMRIGWQDAGDLDDIDVALTTYNLASSTPEERRLFRLRGNDRAPDFHRFCSNFNQI